MLLAVCGLAGAGKTTSVDALESLGRGARVYVGAFVTAAVERRGLSATPENERLVREELRVANGMAALAQLALPTIRGILDARRIALVDAIYCVEELELYQTQFGQDVVRIAVETEILERERRLANRALRPITSEELAMRDEYELKRLGLDFVISSADYKIRNNGSLNDLKNALKRLPFGVFD